MLGRGHGKGKGNDSWTTRASSLCRLRAGCLRAGWSNLGDGLEKTDRQDFPRVSSCLVEPVGWSGYRRMGNRRRSPAIMVQLRWSTLNWKVGRNRGLDPLGHEIATALLEYDRLNSGACRNTKRYQDNSSDISGSENLCLGRALSRPHHFVGPVSGKDKNRVFRPGYGWDQWFHGVFAGLSNPGGRFFGYGI